MVKSLVLKENKRKLLTVWRLLDSLQACKQFQSLVFFGFHNLTLPWAFVVDSTQVKDAMDNGAMKFLFVARRKLFRIGVDGV